MKKLVAVGLIALMVISPAMAEPEFDWGELTAGVLAEMDRHEEREMERERITKETEREYAEKRRAESSIRSFAQYYSDQLDREEEKKRERKADQREDERMWAEKRRHTELMLKLDSMNRRRY